MPFIQVVAFNHSALAVYKSIKKIEFDCEMKMMIN